MSDPRDKPKSKIPMWLPVLTIVVGLLGANYFFLGYGPRWAHRPKAVRPGSTWLAYRDPSGIDVRLPAAPIVDRVEGPTGTIDRARNEVDGRWVATLSKDHDSPAAQMAARATRHATVVFGTANSPGDLGAAPFLISAVVPGAHFTDPSTTPVTGEDAVDMVARYNDFPDQGDTGTARARVTRKGAVSSIAVVLTQDGDDPALLGHLVGSIHLPGVP